MEISYKEMYQMNKIEARKRIVKLYAETDSVKKTAKILKTSRNVVRKWLKRWEEEGEKGLQDLSRAPYHCPRQTPEKIEKAVIEMRKKTNYGKRRLRDELIREKSISISENTIRNILRRNNLTKKVKFRHRFYPAKWFYDDEPPFTLAQVDTKDIHDKQTLGTFLCHYINKYNLPRYQWTFCEAKVRLRFIAFSYSLNQTNGIAFVKIVMLWLRLHGINQEIYWQEDWGQEFGGDNPEKLKKIDETYYRPLGSILARAPKGRKHYQGKVERSHRTDDEEFYLPYLKYIKNEKQFLRTASKWIYYYNTQRFHYGNGMDGKTPFEKLLDYNFKLNKDFCAFPCIILDKLPINFVLKGGNDLSAPYII